MTIAPLRITEPLVKLMWSKYDIADSFANVVASFGQVPHLAEARSNNAMVKMDGSDGGELAYQIRYVEMNLRKGPNPWSLRHTGVYHRLRSAQEVDTVVFLHPVSAPRFEGVIAELQHDHTLRQRLCQDPVLLHRQLFACYFDQWRWYIRDLGERFHKENDLAMVTKVQHAKPKETFDRIQSLRNTTDLLLFARACCAGNHDLLESLSSKYPAQSHVFDAESAKLCGYIESTDVLNQRVQNLIDLVSSRSRFAVGKYLHKSPGRLYANPAQPT